MTSISMGPARNYKSAGHALNAESLMGTDTVDPIATNHLHLAEYLAAWAQDLFDDSSGRTQPYHEEDFMMGYQRALSDLADHLRAGDGLPGGPLQIPA